MRISNRDWIAWSVAVAIAVVGAYYYISAQTDASTADVYRIVVTPDRS